MSKNLLGRDLKLVDEEFGSDLSVDLSGDLAVVEGEYNLSQAILNRLRTRLGELTELGHPDYGSRLYELIGQPNNERTRNLARIYTAECIAKDPRVKEIISINVRAPKDDPNRIDIEIAVKPIGSSNILNIVVPFYLEVY